MTSRHSRITRLAVRGSEAIEQASRTTSGNTLNKSRAGDPDERDTSAQATPDEDVRETSSQAVPDTDDRETSREVAPAVDNSETTIEPVATPAYASTAHMAPVVPQQREHLAGANLHDLVPGDMLNLAQVRSPRSPLVPAIIAIAGLALAVLLALTGLGSDPAADTSTTITVNGQSVSGDEIVEVDLTEPFAVGNIDAESVNGTLLGIPIGSAAIEDGNLDPGYFRYSGAGVIELTPEVEGAQPFPVRSSNSVYLTAPFIVAAMIALGGMASVQSNLRGMRSRRIRMSPYVGLAISGAIAGAGLAVLAMLVLSTPTSVASIIGVAIPAAVGSVALGEGYRRRRRRQRLKRVTVATARR
jgi:hypothetical protein